MDEQSAARHWSGFLEKERSFGSGSKICMKVLDMDVFKSAQKIGIYVHCARLREVNTSWIIAEALDQGDPHLPDPWVCQTMTQP